MTYRVIQWATGAMGKTCLRAIIDHPGLTLAGLFVYSDSKAGRDAGDIARREETGVIATNRIEDILAIDADVVIHCGRITPPYGTQDDEIIRLLESGKNVISINGYSDPKYWGGERQAALEAACARGKSTLSSAGLNPGFVGEQLAVVASGVCSRLDHLFIREAVDCSVTRDPGYVFDSLGFGADPDKVDPNDPSWPPASLMNGMYHETVSVMAQRLDFTLSRIETQHRVFASTRDVQIAAGLIKQGTVARVNWRWVGYSGDEPRLTMSIDWYMDPDQLDEPHHSLWKITITGQPCVEVNVEMSKHPDDKTMTSAEQFGVAGSVVNSIPDVCAAPPGLLPPPVATPFSGRMSNWG